VRELDAAGIAVHDVAARRATLDDVFFALTGHAAEDGSTNGEVREPDESGDGAGKGRRTGGTGDDQAASDGDRVVLQEAES
jgi:ABC-2 type transport system ATP-binding protein